MRKLVHEYEWEWVDGEIRELVNESVNSNNELLETIWL